MTTITTNTLSTWGECLFIEIQLVIIVLLMLAYTKKTAWTVPFLGLVGAAFYALLSGGFTVGDVHISGM